jgi:ribosomal protein S12 methylthiotransferase accessory factor
MGEPSGVVLLGKGLLADAIARTFADREPVRGEAGAVTAGCRLVVIAHDGWDVPARHEVRQACREAATPWLPVRVELGHVVVGPVEAPDTPGCVDCADSRRGLARQHPDGYDAVWKRHGHNLRQRPSSLLTRLAADLVGVVVEADAIALLDDQPTVRTRSAMLYVDLASLRLSAHRFLPDPSCGTCGGLPVDDAAAARVDLRSRPKPDPDRYRIREVADEATALRHTYVDAVSGVVRSLRRDHHGSVVVAAAAIGLRDGAVEHGFGRTGSYEQSELIAVLEALERYGGMAPGGRRTAVRASYRALHDRAVDPRSLGVHFADSYRRPGFPFQPFDEDLAYRWVWGYSFARQEPVLVPESYVYYRTPHVEGDPLPAAYEVSNGCALGGCLEEAILHGILEVAERDAFLMTWYARMPVPRIDLDSARDRTIPTMAELMRTGAGYHTMLFDTTVEHGVPCVWAMAVDPTDDPDRPKAVCAAGSHLDAERAARNALGELGSILDHVVRTFPNERLRARAMANDPALVTQMADHSLLYGDRHTFDRLGFLAATPDTSFAEMSTGDSFRHADLRDDLLELAGRYIESGLDVVVVDQTTPEHVAGGLCCVKVIIPGTLPMTFGHQFRRIDGLPRLYEVPWLLGYRDRRLGPEDVNPHPHPFP